MWTLSRAHLSMAAAAAPRGERKWSRSRCRERRLLSSSRTRPAARGAERVEEEKAEERRRGLGFDGVREARSRRRRTARRERAAAAIARGPGLSWTRGLFALCGSQVELAWVRFGSS